jgi:hypothetical protein
MNAPTLPKPASFSQQAAKLSWVCPIILFGLLAFSRQMGAPLIIDLVALLFIVAGLAFGVIALFGIPRHGAKGILVSAIAGLVINGLLLFIFVSNFIAARIGATQ